MDELVQRPVPAAQGFRARGLPGDPGPSLDPRRRRAGGLRRRRGIRAVEPPPDRERDLSPRGGAPGDERRADRDDGRPLLRAPPAVDASAADLQAADPSARRAPHPGSKAARPRAERGPVPLLLDARPVRRHPGALPVGSRGRSGVAARAVLRAPARLRGQGAVGTKRTGTRRGARRPDGCRRVGPSGTCGAGVTLVAMPLLILLCIVVPLVELYVIIEVGRAIGVWPTIALLFLDGVLGAMLLRAQGRAAWRRFNLALSERRVPARETFDGAMVIVGGTLLLTPGFITDVFGLLLLLPPSRARTGPVPAPRRRAARAGRPPLRRRGKRPRGGGRAGSPAPGAT